MKKIHWGLAFALLAASVATWTYRPKADGARLLREVPRASGLDQSFYRVWLSAEREQRIRDLDRYSELGVFPHNHEVGGKRVPVFMDRHARLCAVAYLAACSIGRTGFDYTSFRQRLNVADFHSFFGLKWEKPDPWKNMPEDRRVPERVASLILSVCRSNNQVRIAGLHRGPLYDWILGSGLTQEECALIQPDYDEVACDDCLPGSEAKPERVISFWHAPLRAREERDRTRLQAHFAKVLRQLREQREASLALAATRLVERLGRQ